MSKSKADAVPRGAFEIPKKMIRVEDRGFAHSTGKALRLATVIAIRDQFQASALVKPGEESVPSDFALGRRVQVIRGQYKGLLGTITGRMEFGDVQVDVAGLSLLFNVDPRHSDRLHCAFAEPVSANPFVTGARYKVLRGMHEGWTGTLTAFPNERGIGYLEFSDGSIGDYFLDVSRAIALVDKASQAQHRTALVVSRADNVVEVEIPPEPPVCVGDLVNISLVQLQIVTVIAPIALGARATVKALRTPATSLVQLDAGNCRGDLDRVVWNGCHTGERELRVGERVILDASERVVISRSDELKDENEGDAP